MPRGKASSKLSHQGKYIPYDAIKKIAAHTLDPETALVTLTVLVKGAREEVSEWDLQENRPALLYEYWAGFNGKTRQDVLGIGDLYHPYRLLRHRRVRGQWQVLVQWLGYSDEGEDVSWEPAVKVRTDAPDILADYCAHLDDQSVKAALLGPLARSEEAQTQADEPEDVKPAVATPASAKQTNKRKRESLTEQPEHMAEKRRRSSRNDSTPAAKASLPSRPSTAKRRQSQAPVDLPPTQHTPKTSSSIRRQSRIPADTNVNPVSPPARAQPQPRRRSMRAGSVAPAAASAERLSPADVPRTMLWFMDDFTVGDMQKVCRFIDEHCTGKLRLPLYSGGDWDGKAASGRWEDVFMVSPLGRLGRYDNEEEKDD
ncbi:hypothetical protein CCHL11_10100 [Colletotrichum chlorophyti]|uniref:Chromo domain-containing protein n=1 Tax=Colletotrichum chlorophyti TaxID=708187 RepID=A0A1Q8RTG5_9PEZI|nr:hypothetical protein CCHL11_10100 [Colletotrichum chlorophyti]